MAIRVKLDEIMKKRGRGLTDLAEEIDITLANLSILKNNKARAVRFSTLEALCKALECQPGEILEYIGDNEDEDAKE
ncbi:MAG: helix-turn-helix transcriptional regulator [Lachnospiraceae bacterium]|nr:helix-turn-helix transcriptional regulator [Lachnospiraceae bacterium]